LELFQVSREESRAGSSFEGGIPVGRSFKGGILDGGRVLREESRFGGVPFGGVPCD